MNKSIFARNMPRGKPAARPVVLRFPSLTPDPKETLSMVDTTADTVKMPSILQIQHRLRRLVDFQQRPVFGIDVIRWPGWGKWCYEIESYGRRPGVSEIVAAKIIRLMLDGATYHQAFAEVTGKAITPRLARRRPAGTKPGLKNHKTSNSKGICKCR